MKNFSRPTLCFCTLYFCMLALGVVLCLPPLAGAQDSPPPNELVLGQHPVSHWVAELKSDDVARRRAAAAAIATIRQIYRKSPATFRNAEVVPQMILNLSDSDANVRENIAWALGWSYEGQSKAAARAALLKTCLEDSVPRVQIRAAQSLTNWSIDTLAPREIIGVLSAHLDSSDADVATLALEALWGAKPSETSVPTLTALTKHRDPRARRVACDLVGTLEREPAQPAVAGLIALLSDPQQDVRAAAAKALGAVGPSERQVVEPLTKMLREDSDEAQANAARALGRLGEAAHASTPDLIAALANPALRSIAATSLGQLHTQPKLTIPALSAHLSDSQVEVRRSVASALAGFGADAQSVAPDLHARVKELLEKDENYELQAYLAAVVAIAPEMQQTQSQIEAALDSDRKAQVALRALGQHPHKAFVPMIIKRLRAFEKGKPEYQRILLVSVLRKLGPDAKPAVPLLLEIYASGSLPSQIASALKEIDPAASLPPPPDN